MIRFPFISSTDTLLYLAAAIGPAAVLLYYIYQKDKADREPSKLLFRLFVGGVLSAALAVILEYASEYLEYALLGNSGPYNMYAIFEACMVGVIEEGSKYLFLKKISWRNPAFNYLFDGIVYAVFVSLGFAAIENVLYVLQYKTADVMIQRAILTIPAHMSFAVYMGLFYSRARLFFKRGDKGASRLNLRAGFCAAALLHAFYDGCLMVDMEYSFLVFCVFVAVLDYLVFRTIRKESRADRPI